jgi:hypothetical protein
VRCLFSPQAAGVLPSVFTGALRISFGLLMSFIAGCATIPETYQNPRSQHETFRSETEAKPHHEQRTHPVTNITGNAVEELSCDPESFLWWEFLYGCFERS